MTDWVIRKFATDVDEPVLAEPRGRVSSSASWKHSGRRDAVKLAARLQNTLTYYQTILGSNLICGATNLRGKTGIRASVQEAHMRTIQNLSQNRLKRIMRQASCTKPRKFFG